MNNIGQSCDSTFTSQFSVWGLMHSFLILCPAFLTFCRPASSPQYPYHTISKFHNYDCVQVAWVDSYMVWCWDEYTFTEIINSRSHSKLFCSSMTCMTSPIWIMLSDSVSNSVFTFSLCSTRKATIRFFGHQSTWFGFENFSIAYTILPGKDKLSRLTIWSEELRSSRFKAK